MVEPKDHPEKDAQASAEDATQTAPGPPGPPPQPPAQIPVDDSRANTGYANFCRVTGTPEELILDFGLNPQPFGVPSEPIAITHRIITNLFTAKRILHLLQLTVQRHEATFGAVEIDVQKRVAPRNA